MENYPDCSVTKHQQSPIDIPASVVKPGDEASFDITHNYYAEPSPDQTYMIENNGRTVEIHFGETGYRLNVGNVAYKPVQAHIHYDIGNGSEDALSDQKFVGEVRCCFSKQRISGPLTRVLKRRVQVSIKLHKGGLETIKECKFIHPITFLIITHDAK